VRQGLLARDLAVAPAQHAGRRAARRREALEALLRQQQRRTGIEGVGDDEGTRAVVQRTKTSRLTVSSAVLIMSRHRILSLMSFDLVLFGGTGDLAWRKLLPALLQAFRHGKLPENGRILAVSRQEMSDDAYRAWLKERFQEVEGAKRPSDDEFGRFAALLHYQRLDLSHPEGYGALRRWLEGGAADVVVMYLATSPDLFPTVCAQLGEAGLNGPHVRVVLEKPLGHDLASAREINRVVRSVFREEQAFRIDHYLGKPSVQNLMALRFGNALFEPLWRARPSPTSRSPSPRPSASAPAATSTAAPGRCAT
jgi:hypothetical protein